MGKQKGGKSLGGRWLVSVINNPRNLIKFPVSLLFRSGKTLFFLSQSFHSFIHPLFHSSIQFTQIVLIILLGSWIAQLCCYGQSVSLSRPYPANKAHSISSLKVCFVFYYSPTLGQGFASHHIAALSVYIASHPSSSFFLYHIGPNQH